MRFTEDGPSIPSGLLKQRDNGNVVFFCGAGVSREAGLPDFGGLTHDIITRLGSIEAAEALGQKQSFDRVFNALIREFGAPEVNREIYRSLKTPRRPNLRNHEIVLNLSTNINGAAQVVTTNFDRLFEKADKGLRCYFPPSLPELSLGQPLEGITYLHGRLQEPDNHSTSGYVLGSSDFGRAYLAEGWATRFVTNLRTRFTIVLLGYSADDPPMRYLLEGLHSANGRDNQHAIYTFSPGAHEEAVELWRDRGVIPIPYDAVDKSHSGLWDSLETWANAAKKPESWSTRVLCLASRTPEKLSSFERGQVAQLITSKRGANNFAALDPPPPAEWLCVFDPHVRYAPPPKNCLKKILLKLILYCCMAWTTICLGRIRIKQSGIKTQDLTFYNGWSMINTIPN